MPVASGARWRYTQLTLLSPLTWKEPPMSTQLEPEAASPSRSVPRHPQLAEQAAPEADGTVDGTAEDPPPPPTNTGNRGRRPQPIVPPTRSPGRR